VHNPRYTVLSLKAKLGCT